MSNRIASAKEIEEKKVRDFITLKPYQGVFTVDRLSPETIINSYIFTDESTDTFIQLFRELTKYTNSDRKSFMICGDRGVGKTHSLAVFRELLRNPNLAEAITNPGLKAAVEHARARKYIIVDIHCLPTGEESIKELFYRQFVSIQKELFDRELPPLDIWLETNDSDDQISFINEFIPEGYELIILLDDVSEKLLGIRNFAKIIGELEFLLTLALATSQFPIFVVSSFFEKLLEPPEHTRKYDALHQKLQEYQLPQHHNIRHISKTNIVELIGSNIVVKTPAQKRQLQPVHEYLSANIPYFKYTAKLFEDLYPIHPMVFQLSFHLHRHIKNFSLLSFIHSTVNKILTYRCTALATIDLIFDLLNHQLRKIPPMARALESYDLVESKAIASMPISERVLARMILKSVFLLSITDEFEPTVENIINALLLTDFQNKPITREDVDHILQYFARSTPEAIQKKSDADYEGYHLITAEHESVDSILQEIRKEKPELRDKVQRRIYHSFCQLVPAIRLNRDNFAVPLSSEPVAVTWRGTVRSGFACWAGNYNVVHVPPMELRTQSALQEIVSADDPDQTIESLVGSMPPPLPGAPHPESTDRHRLPDWQLLIHTPLEEPPNSSLINDLTRRHPSLLVIIPALFTSEDHELAETEALLNAEEFRGRFSEVEEELHQRRQQLADQLGTLMHSRFFEDGLLFYNGTSLPLAEKETVPDTILPVIEQILDDIYSQYFPLHPKLTTSSEILEDRGLIIRSLISGTFDSPEFQETTEQVLLPLGLIHKSKKGLVFDAQRDEFLELPYIADLVWLVGTYPQKIFPLNLFYTVFGRSPLGLQPPVVDIILLSLVAAGKIKIFSSDRADVEVINQMSLSGEIDLRFFDFLQAIEERVLPLPELLQWGYMLSKEEQDMSGSVTHSRSHLRLRLEEWLEVEKKSSFDEMIRNLPNEMVTTFMWREIQSCYRNSTAIINIVENISTKQYSLEEGLSLLANTFSNNLQAFAAVLREIENIRQFLEWIPDFIKARIYVLTSSKTDDQTVETLRYDLSTFFERPTRLTDPDRRQRFTTKFGEFRDAYIRFYVEKHDAQLDCLAPDGELATIMGEGWWKNLPYLSKIIYANPNHLKVLNQLLSSLHERECHLPVADILAHSPHCECGFRLNTSRDSHQQVQRILRTAKHAVAEYKEFFSTYKSLIIKEMQKIPSLDDNTARQVISMLNGTLDHPLSIDAVKLINFILKRRIKVIQPDTLAENSPAGLVSKSDLMQNMARLLREIEDSRELFFMIDGGES